MNNWVRFKSLVEKDMLLEWRMKYALGGMVLYVVSTVFIIYVSFIQLQPNIWNTMFWIVLLFAALNVNAKSFTIEAQERNWYYYSVTDPLILLAAKLFYNICLLLLVSILTLAIFFLLFGNPIREVYIFLVAVLLGSLGMSIAFTFVSAIASRAKNSATLMTVMGFPIIIPLLLTLIKISASGLRLITDTSLWKDIAMLGAIDLTLLAAMIFLFPYLWRE